MRRDSWIRNGHSLIPAHVVVVFVASIAATGCELTPEVGEEIADILTRRVIAVPDHDETPPDVTIWVSVDGSVNTPRRAGDPDLNLLVRRDAEIRVYAEATDRDGGIQNVPSM